jgi:glycosyltransferase involved in cell wall biosynthesis
MKEKIKATIMIPAYNAERFISQALKSALEQTCKERYEILVVNDGSTDDTRGIIEFYKKRNPSLRLINQENSGTSSARNKLLAESRGEILFGLDADDELGKLALEKVLSFFSNNSNVGMIYTDQAEMDKRGKKLRERKRSECHIFFEDITYHCHFQGHLKSFRKEVVNGFRFNESLKSAVDWDFFLKLIPNINVKNIPEILYSYRINESGISFTKRSEVIQNSIDIVKKYVSKRNLYRGKDFEVIPINVGENIHYYDHLVDGKSTMKPEAKKVLLDYLKG